MKGLLKKPLFFKEVFLFYNLVKNIFEGGVLETQFAKFTEHFTINKIDVYGNSSNELKKFVEAFGLNFNFYSLYAKYSRKQIN